MLKRRALMGTLLGGGLLALLPSPGRAAAGTLPRPPVPPRRPPRPVGPLVMLDPGHGGKDPGTSTRDGLREKTVTLAVALRLRRLLLAAGYRVVMTRSRDVFVSLHERVAMAERARPALFLSLHANWAHDPAVRGASAYTLGGAASDAQAESVARLENGAGHTHARRRGLSRRLSRGLPLPPQVAPDPARRAESERFAAALVAALDPDMTELPGSVRRAAFAVLRSTARASALVEMGFLSSPRDTALLRAPAGQARVAADLAGAVGAYFRAAPGVLAAAGHAAEEVPGQPPRD